MGTTLKLTAEDTLRDPRWVAVRDRDASVDGEFWYSVATTGVYCRPGCGARTPRPEHVRFHVSAAAAELAGFRPCQRCHPDQPTLHQRDAALVAEVCRKAEAAEEMPSAAELARLGGVSSAHLLRAFKRVTGLTPRDWLAGRKAAQVRQALSGGASVTDALHAAGYGSSGRFYEQADAALGMTPGAFRAGGADERIRFAVAQCSLGAILVAESGRGVCAISLGDNADALVRDLQARFAQAELEGDDPAFDQRVAQVVALVEQPQRGFDLPLDLRGTAFQQRVWNALREIPAGVTLSYAELARRLGMPSAARAVGTACAANTLAVVVPCHRIVRVDGGLSGYRWGVERKRELLEREQGETP